MSTTAVLMLTIPVLGLGLLMMLTVTMAAMFRRKVDPTFAKTGVVPAEAHAHVLELIAQGRQIDAIKALRRATGMGLKEAKEYCDALRHGTPPQPGRAANGTVPPEAQIRAMHLLRQRKLIEAVKVVRDASGMSLKDAKRYCEDLRDGRIPPPVRKPLSDRVRAFVDNGDRAAAVALVQTETGMSREEAERFVAALEP